MARVQSEVGLIDALSGDFWTYARMTVAPGVLSAFEADVAAAGLRVPGRPFPLPEGGGAHFRRLLELSGPHLGRATLRRLGYACGQSAARAFEANVRSPAHGASRMARAFEAACQGSEWAVREGPGPQVELAIAFEPPASGALLAFLSGFVKGAATRLNEGTAPVIVPVEQSPLRWRATLEWAVPPVRPPATGDRRTRHRE